MNFEIVLKRIVHNKGKSVKSILKIYVQAEHLLKAKEIVDEQFPTEWIRLKYRRCDNTR